MKPLLSTSRKFVDSSTWPRLLLTRLRLWMSPHSSHIISRILRKSWSLTFIKTSLHMLMYLYIPNILLKSSKGRANHTSYASIIRRKLILKFISLHSELQHHWNLQHIFNVDSIHAKDMVTFPPALIHQEFRRMYFKWISTDFKMPNPNLILMNVFSLSHIPLIFHSSNESSELMGIKKSQWKVLYCNLQSVSVCFNLYQQVKSLSRIF